MYRFLRLSLIHFLWNLPLLFFLLWLAGYVILRGRTEILLLTEDGIPEGTAYLLLVRDGSRPAEGIYSGGWVTKDGKTGGRWLPVLFAPFFQAEYRLPMLFSDRYGKLSGTAFPWAVLLLPLAGIAALVLSVIGTVELFRQWRRGPVKPDCPEGRAQ
ncbi:MAG: hypothetical protein IJS14_05665 [Lentisphaeria bacterium]|nr:hypothetical protein [Lentisphaeria bacterium]